MATLLQNYFISRPDSERCRVIRNGTIVILLMTVSLSADIIREAVGGVELNRFSGIRDCLVIVFLEARRTRTNCHDVYYPLTTLCARADLRSAAYNYFVRAYGSVDDA